jgi:phosphatidate cytidylyltransferase
LTSSFARNLLSRVVTALLVLPLLLAAFLLGPMALGAGIVALASALGLVEFFAFLRARGLVPMRLTGFVLAAAMFTEIAFPGWQSTPAWPLAALLVLMATLSRGSDFDKSVPAAAATLLGAVYLGALGGTIAGLVTLAPAGAGGWRIVLLLAIIMVSDTFAFFVGHAWGRRRLAPSVSPGKTVEGAFGGLVGGVVAALGVHYLGLPTLPVSHAVGLGVLVAALGIVGDLDESLLKRWAGVKDSGALFPGHGGMLDRLDSLLFGAPVLYYYFLFVRA